MTSIKLKFRPSTVLGKPGVLYYRVIQNRIVRQITTQYRIYAEERDRQHLKVNVPDTLNSRSGYLKKVQMEINKDLRKFYNIISSFEQNRDVYTGDDVIAEFVTDNPENYLFHYERCHCQPENIGQDSHIGNIRCNPM